MTNFYKKQLLKPCWSLKYPTNFRKYCLILKSKLSYWINQMEGKNMSEMAFYYSGYNLTINYLMFYLTQLFEWETYRGHLISFEDCLKSVTILEEVPEKIYS